MPRPAMTTTKRLSLLPGALLLAGALAAGCSSGSKDQPSATCDPIVGKANLACGDADVTAALQILRAMTLEEKVQQMSGPPFNASNMFDQQDNARLGVRGHKYMDGPRGVRWYNSDNGTTVYPVAAARASTWNVELERRIGKACADEMRDLGRHVLLAPTINQVMHPRWGRAQESYGEDTFLLGAMGSSFVQGVQYDPNDPADPNHVPGAPNTYRVQSCVKHFAANNIEDTRIYVNAVVDPRTLREVYLPHFRKAVEAGASCVMASYNRVNGSYSCYSVDNVRNVLKGEWGYQGYVISDWFAKGNTLTSPVAGLDVEMPFSSGTFPTIFDSQYFYGAALTDAVNKKLVDEKLVDEAVLRILHRKVQFGVTRYAPAWTPWLTKSDATQALALEAARQGMVLLKNGPTRSLADDVLPLDRTALTKIAVVGKYANAENMGDKGSSDAKVVDSSLVITPYEGISAAFAGAGQGTVTFETVAGNEASLQDANVLVVVAAYYPADLARTPTGEEGEWKDRVSMALPARDLANIAGAVALKAVHPALRVVVVMKSGGAIVVDDWIAGVDALVMSWYAGMKEGTALAEILFGDVNPSGKLCQSFPARESDLPAFDNTTTGDVAYGYYHGYRWLERQGIAPRYAFGFGQSYTTFAYSNLALSSAAIGTADTLSVTVDVRNTGPVAGSEVVQLYVGYANTAVTAPPGRSVKELKAFARAEGIAPGETRKVTLTVKASDLAYWNASAGSWTVEKIAYPLFVGPSSDASDPNMQVGSFTIH